MPQKCLVLILVLVEDGLRGPHRVQPRLGMSCLNPCFSGGWSQRLTSAGALVQQKLSLNPCFSGGWSQSSKYVGGHDKRYRVLILVLVEDGLREQLLEVSVNETVITMFLISLTFGDQKYVPFRVLSQMQIYEFSVSANMFFEDISEFFCGDAWSKK